MGGNVASTRAGFPLPAFRMAACLVIGPVVKDLVGSRTDGVTASYTLSGGTFSSPNAINFTIGAGMAGTGSTTFTLAGSGKLL